MYLSQKQLDRWCDEWERRARILERKRQADLRRKMERSVRSRRRRRMSIEAVLLLPLWRVLRAVLAGDWRAAAHMVAAGFAPLFAALHGLVHAPAAPARRIPALLRGRARRLPTLVKAALRPLARRCLRRT